MFNVSVVVINFNSLKYILKCINHLLFQKGVKLEIIIVDNNSSDNSLVCINKKAALNNQIKIVALDKNVGSSVANNVGIKLCKYDSILILNADVFLEQNFIFKSCEQLYSNPRIGTVIGKLLSSKNNNVIDSVGIKLFREGIGDDIGMGEIDNLNFSKPCTVYGACCAAALYKIDMLRNIAYKSEYYDESFFAYNEDLDLSIRSHRFGWYTLYVPDAVGYHVRGGSTAKYNSFINFLTFRNLFLFQIKHFHPSDPVSFILNITYMLLRFMLLKNEYKLKFLNCLLNLKDILNKRNDINNRSHHDIDFSKFESYLLKKIKKVF
jgi:GT2 family glycosyltransferase